MKMMKENPFVPTEHVEQTQLFSWARWQSSVYPALNNMFAIPNGGKRAIKTAANLKEEGVKAGVSDVFLPFAASGYYGIFIEIKKIKNSRVEKEQIEFINSVRKNGYAADICFGFEDARDTLLLYLTGKYTNKPLQLTAKQKRSNL